MNYADWKVLELKNIISSSYIETNLKESPPPYERSKVVKYSGNRIEKIIDEEVVRGSFGRYNYPRYKETSFYIKQIVEEILKEKIYPTYYFDRFYFNGNSLRRHIDRQSCEISISVNIQNTTNVEWPLFFDYKGNNHGFIFNPGDAILYKGMEIEHWRNPLNAPPETFFHQAFFHYVRADGHFIQYAYDKI